jgi:hypothetical protein
VSDGHGRKDRKVRNYEVGRAAEDIQRQKEMLQRSKAKIVNFDDMLDELMSGETRG